MKTAFEQFLDNHDETAWRTAVMNLLPEIHEVDRAATQIWFRFYPITLFRALQQTDDRETLVRQLQLEGDFELVNRIDASHKFLYGHRYWTEVKAAVVARAENYQPNGQDLTGEIKQIAREICERTKISDSLLVGITGVCLMTLVQVGLDRLRTAPGAIQVDQRHLKKSPERILAERAKDDSQGLLGFLKTVNKTFTVTYDENVNNAGFKAVEAEEVASASARDQSQNWKERDPRCVEGVIPVQCRSAACGTCWVGVLGGAEKLSDVSKRERRAIKSFGYINTDEPKPLIRLACMAGVAGAVSVVIPPWNGVFGKHLHKEDFSEETLLPATTSAKENRTTLREATRNQLG